jgi:hypothetical protein
MVCKRKVVFGAAAPLAFGTLERLLYYYFSSGRLLTFCSPHQLSRAISHFSVSRVYICHRPFVKRLNCVVPSFARVRYVTNERVPKIKQQPLSLFANIHAANKTQPASQRAAAATARGSIFPLSENQQNLACRE